MADDILVRIDVDSSRAMAATSAYGKALDRLDAQLTRSAKAQANLDKAIAASGASSNEAAAAQAKYDAALKRTTAAQDQAAIAAKRSSEIQVAAAQKAAAAQEAAAAKQAAAFRKLGTVAGGIGLVIGAGFALAAKSAADFNAKMAQVQSLTRANAADMAKLTEATKGFTNIGASASDAADAEIELVKAGISVKDIIGGALKGALNLAAAGQIDFGTATSIAASAMTQFQLQGKDIPHVADLLAAGADRALGSVQDLGEGMTYAGLGAHQLGISVDDTVAALAEFANAGLIGSQGGTTLQQVLRQLTGPTASAAKEIQALGLNIYNAQGNFVGLASIAGQLHDKLGNLSQADRDAALNTLFTSRAVRGATILYQDGAAGVDAWQKKVQQSGFAAEQATGKMNSLSGDLQKLGAVVQNDLISVGEQLQPMLRAITKDLTSIGEAIGGLPDPVKAVGVQFGVAVAALGLGFWAFTRLKAAAVGLAETLGVLAGAQVRVGTTAATMAEEETAAASAMTRTSGAAGLAGRLNKGAALRGGVGLGLLLGGSVASQQGGATGAIGGPTLNAAGLALLMGGGATTAGPIGALVALLAAAKYAGDHPGPKYTAPRNDFANSSFTGSFTNGQQVGTLAPFETSAAQTNKVLAQLGVTGQQTYSDLNRVSQGAGGASASLKDLASAADDAWKKLLQVQNAALTQRGDFRGYQQAIDDANAALKENGATLNANTQKGRDNAAALDQIASSASAYAQTISDPILQLKFLQDSRAQLQQTAESFGMSKQAAKDYVNQVLGIPKQAITEAQFEKNQAYNDVKTYEHAIDSVPGFKDTVVTAHTEQAIGALARVAGLLGVIHSKDVFINVNTQYTHSGVQVQPASGGYISGGKLHKFAQGGSFPEGGYIRGPGTGTSDSIPAMISNGEFVMRAAAVKRYGVGFMHSINQMRDGGLAGRSAGATFVMSDPALLRRLESIEARLSGQLHTVVDNAGEVAGAVGQKAHQIVRSNTNLQANVAMAQATR